MALQVMVVEDDASQRKTIEVVAAKTLQADVQSFADGMSALASVLGEKAKWPDLMLLDMHLPDMSGIDIIEKVRSVKPGIPILVLTASQDVATAVKAMQAGANDYMIKPIEAERLKVSAENAFRVVNLASEVDRLSRSITGQITFSDLIGNSQRFIEAIKLAKKVAASNIPVLLEGESGVGKEIFARAIHGSSERAGKPFITVNCGAIPENLVESILFGHEKGAFTGAVYKSIGKFREADGGTIFLDEIGDLKPDLQVKLLRVLQQGEVEPVGGKGSVKIDVRVISATHRRLANEVEAGRFREDLYYRLNVFAIEVPSLRTRKQDIPELANYFLHRFVATEGKRIAGISEEAVDLLINYYWPGNVRQLENMIFRAVVICERDKLEAADFPGLNGTLASGSGEGALVGGGGGFDIYNDDGHIRALQEVETDLIKAALKHYQGHMSEIARRLGLGRSTLYRKIGELGLDQHDTDGAKVLRLRQGG